MAEILSDKLLVDKQNFTDISTDVINRYGFGANPLLAEHLPLAVSGDFIHYSWMGSSSSQFLNSITINYDPREIMFINFRGGITTNGGASAKDGRNFTGGSCLPFLKSGYFVNETTYRMPLLCMGSYEKQNSASGQAMKYWGADNKIHCYYPLGSNYPSYLWFLQFTRSDNTATSWTGIMGYINTEEVPSLDTALSTSNLSITSTQAILVIIRSKVG